MSSEFTQSDGEDNKPVIKKRHVLLTLYLALMSLYLFGTIGSYSIGLITGKDPISEVLSINPPLFLGPALMTCVLILFHITDLVAIAAIFKWRKWGFWLYVFNALVFRCCWTIYDVEFLIESIILFFVTTLTLQLFLSIGGKNKAWPQLD